MSSLDYEKLARYYDALVTGGEDLKFFVDRATGAGGKVMELMAGTGRVSVPLAAAGVDLTCVDASPAMLNLLKAKLAAAGLDAILVEKEISYLNLATRFSLIFIAFHSFEELTDDEQRRRAMGCILRHLVPGGRFVCTLHDPQVRFREVGAGREMVRDFEDPESGRKMEMRVSTERDGASSIVRGLERICDLETGETLLELPISFRLSEREEFEALAAGAGFELESLEGDFAGGAYAPGSSVSMVFTLHRPEMIR